MSFKKKSVVLYKIKKMNIKKNIKVLLVGIFCVFIASIQLSCEQNELSDLVADDTNNPDVVTYQNTAKFILDNSCVECHNATTMSGGVSLHTFENAAAEAASGIMLARMTSETDPMPPSGNLPDAIIQDLRDWLEDGLLEN